MKRPTRNIIYLISLLFLGGCREDPAPSTISHTSLASGINRKNDNSASQVRMFREILHVTVKKFFTETRHPGAVFRDLSCPPGSMKVDGEIFFTALPPLAFGSGTEVYQDLTQQLVIKVSDLDLRSLEQVWRDSAALQVINNPKVVAKIVFPQEFPRTSQICRLRTVVMQKAGEINLYEYRRSQGPLPKEMVSRIGVAAINLLEAVHATGLVHGDVHGGNFVFFLRDPESTLRLIDFGRARPFVHPETGAHLPILEMTESSWKPQHLSVSELQGYTVSRRDDLFRLSELVIFLISHDDDVWETPENEMVEFKLNRKFSWPQVPSGFAQFYRETIALQFHEKPDYDRFRYLISK